MKSSNSASSVVCGDECESVESSIGSRYIRNILIRNITTKLSDRRNSLFGPLMFILRTSTQQRIQFYGTAFSAAWLRVLFFYVILQQHSSPATNAECGTAFQFYMFSGHATSMATRRSNKVRTGYQKCTLRRLAKFIV